MPWEDVPKDNQCEAEQVSIADSTHAYRHIMQQLEHHVGRSLRHAGKPGLVPTQTGRACTQETKQAKPMPPPLRRSRVNDHQPDFIGDDWQHYHWFRQLRRICSLERLLQAQPTKQDHDSQTQQLWQSILSAHGFAGGFRHYWKTKRVCIAGTLSCLPKKVPDADQLHLIAQNFLLEVRALEKSLNQHRYHQAKMSRLDDPKRIYADLKADRPLPVRTLILKNHAEVTDVDVEGRVHIVPGTLAAHEPVMFQHQVIATQWLSDHVFQLDADVTLAVGDDVHQDEYVGNPADILAESQKLWMTMWDKHRDLPSNHWDEVCTMVTNTIPRPEQPMPYTRITTEQWYAAVRSKKSTTASGPDGVTREDLLRCPVEITEMILDLIHSIEAGSRWPDAAMTGLISTLEKVELAHSPNQFRPICVLSVFYRIWASIRTRQVVDFLSDKCPIGLFGNRKGCDTSQLWWNLALQIRSWHSSKFL